MQAYIAREIDAIPRNVANLRQNCAKFYTRRKINFCAAFCVVFTHASIKFFNAGLEKSTLDRLSRGSRSGPSAVTIRNLDHHAGAFLKKKEKLTNCIYCSVQFTTKECGGLRKVF